MGIDPSPSGPRGLQVHWFLRRGCAGRTDTATSGRAGSQFQGWRVLCFALKHPPPFTVELPVSRYWARHSTPGLVLRRRATELLYTCGGLATMANRQEDCEQQGDTRCLAEARCVAKADQQSPAGRCGYCFVRPAPDGATWAMPPALTGNGKS